MFVNVLYYSIVVMTAGLNAVVSALASSDAQFGGGL